jgi:hypothetical protein
MRSTITSLALGIVLAAATLALPSTGQAQLAGKWALEPAEGGAATSQTQASGGRTMMVRQSFPAHSTLDVRTKGDSAFATWTPTQPAQPPVEMRGKVTGSHLELVGTREAHVLMNGEAQTTVMRLVFDLTRAQDDLSGTLKTTTESGQRVLSTLGVKGERAR